ncbi:MAG: Dam family site-specific DNA-(adenine-N6)-methyltransferase [Actinomycetales bacterium]|nr:Dam family site-specific DNA-(adenine-N6)-methyltransferase [Actinomycetales bacterium]
MSAAKPFLKWAGGKRKQAPGIIEEMPLQIGTYVEPFLGAGAVLLRLLQSECLAPDAVIYGADSNAELINAWRTVKLSVESLIHQLNRIDAEAEEVGREACYYWLRNMFEFDPMESIFSAARTIWLNKNCFNGLYRTNKKGVFNVSWGKHEKPQRIDRENLRAVSQLLRRHKVRLGPKDFEHVLSAEWSLCSRPAVVYCDPPYYPRKANGFVGYGPNGFGRHDHERLARSFQGLKKHEGVLGLLSNADLPGVRALYDEAEVLWSKEQYQSISCSGTGRKGRRPSDLLLKVEGAQQ